MAVPNPTPMLWTNFAKRILWIPNLETCPNTTEPFQYSRATRKKTNLTLKCSARWFLTSQLGARSGFFVGDLQEGGQQIYIYIECPYEKLKPTNLAFCISEFFGRRPGPRKHPNSLTFWMSWAARTNWTFRRAERTCVLKPRVFQTPRGWKKINCRIIGIFN